MATTRREFLKHSALASAMVFVPKFLHGMGQGQIPLLANSNGKRLIVVQLSGGNDGLNTVVPFQNDIYYQMRPSLAIPKQEALRLGDRVDLALNPAMTKLKALYDEGYLSIINNVGYPNPDRSHFRSMDIWHTASDSSQYLTTGWLGRYLDANCSGPGGPYAAIEVDDTLSLAVKGARLKGLALQSPDKLFSSSKSQILSKVRSASNTHTHHDDHHVDYLYKTLIETEKSAEFIHSSTKGYKSSVVYPATEFGRHLKTIAGLVNSEVPSRVFYASLSGFDTHVNQVGQQGRLLGELSDGLHSLVQELKQGSQFDNTLIFVFSEFGRRVKQNASRGTDHGTANNVFLISGSLKKQGILNDSPDLSALDNGDLRFRTDFRDIYASILRDWLSADDLQVLGSRFRGVEGVI